MSNTLEAKNSNDYLEMPGKNKSEPRRVPTYRHVFDSTPNLVFIADSEGRIVEVNPKAQNCFPDEDLVHRFCWEVLEIPVEDINRLFDYLHQKTNREIILNLAKGTHYYQAQIDSFSKNGCQEAGVVLILNDITSMVGHRYDLENSVFEKNRDIQRSQILIDTLFQSIGEGIVLLDESLEVVEANLMASEVFGIPLEVLIGTSFELLTDGRGLNALIDMRDSLTRGEIRSFELIGTYVDGRQFPCRITLASMKLDGEQFWPIITSDISDQKEMENNLVREKQNAEEMNVTLRNVLTSIEEQKKEIEETIASRISSFILPGLAKLEAEEDPMIRSSYYAILRTELTALTHGFNNPLDANLLKLSKTELRVCKLIRAGFSGKEICSTMNIAFETIQSHRKNIRKKLGLRGKNINLYGYLAQKNLESNTPVSV